MACCTPYIIASVSAAPLDPPIKSKFVAPTVNSTPFKFPLAITTAQS